MLTYDLSDRGRTPLYEYLYTSIKNDILTGRIKPSEKLPSKREFAKHLGVSVITVVNAYDQLSAEGYIVSKEKRGYFAAELGASAPHTEKQIREKTEDKGNSLPENDTVGNGFPFSLWAKVMRKVITEKYDRLLIPAPYNGVYELREAISKHLYRTRGLDAAPENIVVGAGTEYLYNLLIQLFGRDVKVAAEDPGHSKIAKIYSANGISLRYIKVGADGLSLPQLKESGANILHFSPSHHYPTGAITPAGKRREILKWAEEGSFHIIEDDYDSEFRLSGKPVETLMSMDRSGRVIYINTFSKSIAPSVRISYMVLPPQLAEAFREKLGFYSCTVPVFEQYTLAEFISGGYFERHVNRMKTFCRKQRDLLPSMLEESGLAPICTVIGKDSGLHFILKLNTSISDKELSAQAEKRGLKLSFVSDHLHRDDTDFEHMLIADYFAISSKRMKTFADMIGELEDGA